MNKKSYIAGIALSLANCLSLGILGIVDKIGTLETGQPLIFSTQSLFLSLIFTFLFTLVYFKSFPTQEIKKLSSSSWILMMLVGVFASGIFILLRFLGLTQSTGTFATLSQIITTSLTALLAWIFIKERLSKAFWVLFSIIILATYFVSVGKIALDNVKFGDFLIASSTIFLAASNIFSRIFVQKGNPILLSLGRFFFGFLFLLIVSFIYTGSQLFVLSTSWVFLSGLLWTSGVITFNLAIQKIGVTLATSLLMTAPVITMALESTALNYHFTYVQIIAAFIVVISGILIIIANKNIKLN